MRPGASTVGPYQGEGTWARSGSRSGTSARRHRIRNAGRNRGRKSFNCPSSRTKRKTRKARRVAFAVETNLAKHRRWLRPSERTTDPRQEEWMKRDTRHTLYVWGGLAILCVLGVLITHSCGERMYLERGIRLQQTK